MGKEKKKYGEEDLSSMEKKASDMSKINVAVGSPYSVYDAIDRANIETVGDVKTDALFADMATKHMEQKGLTPNDNFNKPTDINAEQELKKVLHGDDEFIHSVNDMEESRKMAQVSLDIVHEGAIVSATTNDAVNDGVNDGVSEGVNEGISEGISEGVNYHPEADFHEKQIKEASEIPIIENVEDFLLDPDTIIESADDVKNILLKERDKQNVLKKS